MGVQKPRDSGSRFCYYKVSLSWRLCQTAAIIIWQTSPQHAHAATRCKPTTRPAFAFVASHKTRTTTICPFLIGLIRLLNGGAHTVWPLFAAFRYLRIPKQTLEFAKLQNFESKSPHFSHFDKKHTLDRIHFSFQDDENTPHSMGAAVK